MIGPGLGRIAGVFLLVIGLGGVQSNLRKIAAVLIQKAVDCVIIKEVIIFFK